MGPKNVQSSSSKLKLLATAFLGLALLFHLIAISAPNWATTDLSVTDRVEHIGLWKYCAYPVGGGDSCNDFIDIITGDWLKVAQAFMILGLFILPAAFGLVAMTALNPQFAEDYRVCTTSIAVTGIAVLFTLITVCTFGDRYQEYFNNKEILWYNQHVARLDWAFGLCVTDGIFSLIALVICVIDL